MFAAMRYLFVLFLVLLFSTLARAGGDWTGKTVILKGDKAVKIGHAGANGKVVYLAELRDIDYHVLKEQNGWLHVREGDVEGWFEKVNAVVLEEAVPYFTARIKAKPNDLDAYYRRAYVWELRGEHDFAIKDFGEAIRLSPSNAMFWAMRGVNWDAKKEYDKAIADYSEAIRLKPTRLYYQYRGSCWTLLKQYDNAINDFNEAISLDPKYARAFSSRGFAWEGKKNYHKAVKDYEEASRLDPKNHSYLNDTAWLLATCSEANVRDGKRAVELAIEACKVTEWKNMNILDTLAAAYAEAGEFLNAIKYQKDALALAAGSNIPVIDRKEYEARLKLYLYATPYQGQDLPTNAYHEAIGANIVPEFALLEKLREAHGKAASLYHGGQKEECLKHLLAEFSAAHGLLVDFPKLQDVIADGRKDAVKKSTIDDEVHAFFKLVVDLTKKLDALTPGDFKALGERAWEKGEVNRAEHLFLRAVNAMAAKKQMGVDSAATHRAVVSALFPETWNLDTSAPEAKNIKIVEDPTKNGWEVSVAYKNDQQTSGHLANAWTLGQAKLLAEQIVKENVATPEDLYVAEIQIKGKDGDGEVKADEGPKLPDWPIIEQQFRSRTQAKPKDFDAKLQEIKSAYQNVAQVANDVLRTGKPVTAEKQQLLEQLKAQYNTKLAELDQALGGAQPLPELIFSPQTKWEDHRPGWLDMKRTEYNTEKEMVTLSAKQKALQADQNQLLTQWKKTFDDRVGGQDTGNLVMREIELKSAADAFGQRVKSISKEKSSLQGTNGAIANQLAAQQGQLIDKNRVAPAPDLFTEKPGAAKYISTPQAQVFKTDGDGNPLAEDQQPPGYPKPLLVARALANDEKALFDPSLRVELLPEQPNDLKAGIFAKVAKVDSAAGEITFDIDGKGTQLKYQGVSPAGIKAGDYVTPGQSIGQGRSSPRQRLPQFRIFAVNKQGQSISPGAVLEIAKSKPDTPEQLDKRSVDKSGELFMVDPSAPNASADKLKQDGLAIREGVAKRALDRLKENEDQKISEAGLLKSKLRQVEDELRDSKSKLQLIEKDKDKVRDQANEIEKRSADLKVEFNRLNASKAELEVLAAKAKKSKKEEDQEAFNVKAREHNAKVAKYANDANKFDKDSSTVRDRDAELQRQNTKEEKKMKDLNSEKSSLESKQRTADMDLQTAKAEREAKETELRNIQTEIAQFEAELKARK